MPKGKRGRWKPTLDQIQQIEMLSGFGMTEQEIAIFLGVCLTTFQTAMKKDETVHNALLNGRVKADAKVTETLFKMATRGDCPAATIFWQKVRRRWKEPPSEVQFPDKDGNPMQPVANNILVLSDEELKRKSDELQKKLDELE